MEKKCLNCGKPVGFNRHKSCSVKCQKKIRHSRAVRYNKARRYGVSEEEVERLESVENCEVCDHPIVPSNKGSIDTRHCVDHDHVTGKIRGVLCGRCNLALGYTRDSRMILQKLIEYLNKNL